MNNIEIESATHAYLTRMEVDEYLVRINSIIIGNVTANISAIFPDIIKAQNFLEDIGVAGWDYKSLMD